MFPPLFAPNSLLEQDGFSIYKLLIDNSELCINCAQLLCKYKLSRTLKTNCMINIFKTDFQEQKKCCQTSSNLKTVIVN